MKTGSKSPSEQSLKISKVQKELLESLEITETSVMPDQIFNDPAARIKYEYK